MKQLWGQLPDHAELEVRVNHLEQRMAAMLTELGDLRHLVTELRSCLSDPETRGEPMAGAHRG